MSAIVTDQLRILNTNSFVNSIDSETDSYYVFLSLPNPNIVGFGRDSNWDLNVPNPIDNFNYQAHVLDTMMFGKKITSANTRRVIRKIDWVRGTKYEMYRHDYNVLSPSPITQASRLYDANFYVVNSEYRVYICIDNGSSGINSTGNASKDEPLFTDLEPSKAGESGDGYIWKYLYTISPSDVIKFDSTEYVTVPNDWETTVSPQVRAIRENANSDINENQIKKVYIESEGDNYSSGLGQEVDILGDGSGAKVVVDVVDGKITNTIVSSGGKGYTYGIVDLGSLNSFSQGNPAHLIPIIPPSKGHGFDIYRELGTDRVLIYTRFDDSSKDFPIDTQFAQIGIVRNPRKFDSDDIFVGDRFSSLYSIKLSSVVGTPEVGQEITQVLTSSIGRAYGYVASYDEETKILKYFRDRSLYFNQTTLDQTDYVGITTAARIYDFEASSSPISSSTFSSSIDLNFSGITTTALSGNKTINLGVNFTNGLANPQINKKSGEVIYIDNRPVVPRNPRQKEDIKIVLEF